MSKTFLKDKKILKKFSKKFEFLITIDTNNQYYFVSMDPSNITIF